MAADGDEQMRLRYRGACRVCGIELAAGTEAIYERPTRTVRCRTHDTDPAVPASPGPIDPGVPGASARREFERRSSGRERRIREKHPALGGLILALSEDPGSTKAWDTGALGEERLGNRLTELTSDFVRVLHDRRIPGSRANIDHVVVGPTGVYVIDAKRYRGRPELEIAGGVLRPRVEKLMIAGRDRTKLVDGVLRQVDVVRTTTGVDVPVTGVLCFVEADWPLVGGAFTIRGVEALWPRKLYPRLQASGPLTTAEIADLHARLAGALPSA